jgi:hypothetical protein
MLAKVSLSVERIALATRYVYGDNMIEQDNSVNIKSDGAKAGGAYHHGDLRAAVIAAGLKRLEAGDDGELRLRALARDVGVSATALYRHFPDKGFKATGTTYVRFAHDEPALFRLSFTRQMSARHANVGGDGGEVAYNLLRAGVGEALPGVENPDRAALHAWALVHGLAMLILDRRLEWDEAMVEEVVGLTFGGIA